MSKRIIILLLAVAFLIPGLSYAQRIVYDGLDPTFHTGTGQSQLLIQNQVQWVGGNADPNIAWTGVPNISTRLAAAGFTNLTEIPSASLATTDLSGFDLLYVLACCALGDGPGLVAATANILSFVNTGGGLIVEINILDPPYSWTWVPAADAIGHSGDVAVGSNTILITAPGHPVLAGINEAGLAGWGSSSHSTFSTPAAGGFTTLATNPAGTAVLIASEGAFTTPIPVPTLGAYALAALAATLAALGAWTLIYRRRRSYLS